MKKILCLLFAIAFMFGTIAMTIAPITTHAEAACIVTVQEAENGVVSVDKTEGKVGDTVNISVVANDYWVVQGVFANGQIIEKDEFGVYKFELIEGENVVYAKFFLDLEKLKLLDADQLKGVLEVATNAEINNWEDIFTTKNLFLLISCTINIFTAISLCFTLLKNKKVKAKTTEEVLDEVLTAVKDQNSDLYKTVLGPLVQLFNDKICSVESVVTTLTRCFVLSQEGTPEARLAIVKELANLPINDLKLSEQVKQCIAEEVAHTEATKQEKLDKIAELQQKNDALMNEDKGEDIKGRY